MASHHPLRLLPILSCLVIISVTFLPNLTLSSTTITSCNFPAIFNFGDSNSDTGGLSAAFGQAAPPNGQTFFGSPAGRLCDGRLIIDFIAESLGLPYLSAFLDSLGTNFSHGANFATAGATIRPPNTTKSQTGISPISLDVQFVEFSDFQRRSQLLRKQGGSFEHLFPQEVDFSSALYTFDIGQNDLSTGLFVFNMTNEQVKAYVPDVLSQLSDIIKNVYALGGRSFLVHNTGPAGCSPLALDVTTGADQLDMYGCDNSINEVAQYYNLGLKGLVSQLREDLPLAAITHVDIYTVKYSIFRNARRLGFEEPFSACCGHGGEHNFDISMWCGTGLAQSCEDPLKRILWDGVHYTEAANKWVFDQIVDGSFSDPPIPLNLTCKRWNHYKKTLYIGI